MSETDNGDIWGDFPSGKQDAAADRIDSDSASAPHDASADALTPDISMHSDTAADIAEQPDIVTDIVQEAQPDVVPDVAPDGPDPALAENARKEIISVSALSSCAGYSWKSRGKAPAGYIKGVSLVFARAVCNQSRADVAYVSRAKTQDNSNDALAHYDNIFKKLGMSNNAAGVDTLRHSYTLLLGLGMRESSGKHCEGRDRSASNLTAATAEAGAWQTSWNSRVFKKDILVPMFNKYKADSSGCLLNVFKENVSCSKKNWENIGSGDGLKFQDLSKKCPAFAAEWAAVMLRACKRHYGPLNRKEAEVRTECDNMFQKVQQIIAKTPSVCNIL